MGTRTRGFANFIGTDGKLQQGSLAAGVGGIAFQAVKTANFNAVAGEGYFCNTTSGAITVTLPSGTPTAGAQIQLVDYAGTFDTNALTINPNGNKIEGGTSNLALTGEREGVLLVFTDATQGWIATSGINEGTDALESINYSIDFLVVAGGASGGSGGGDDAGGGGAGGYRTSSGTSGGGGSAESSLTFSPGIVYTITVGAGGASPSGGAKGNNGSDSSISGTGITTITSTGGGGGGGANGANAGANGGSGGGAGGFAGSPYSGGTGTANQGYNGGDMTAVPQYGSGGGGGAGAVGVNGTTSTNGNGGVGVANSLTGSSVTRAGGGGGGGWTNNSTGGTGGTGGGGAGGNNSSNGTAGIVNTGGGGGGGGTSAIGGAGGKGVVILSMPDASYSGTTTGSPTVATGVSGKTVLTFNDSGSYTG